MLFPVLFILSNLNETVVEIIFTHYTESTSICFTNPKSYAFTGLSEYIKIIKIRMCCGITQSAKRILNSELLFSGFRFPCSEVRQQLQWALCSE